MKIEEIIKTASMPLSTKTVINLMYTSRQVGEATASLLKDHDLSVQQYNVLRILKGQKGKPANASTIQERMVDSNSNSTRLVDKLLKKDLVARRVCPDNRRKIEITITASGLELLKILDPKTLATNAGSVSALDNNELELLNNLLDKLRNHE